jgi:CrcB protein
MLSRLLLIASAGAVGTLARYGLSGLVQRITGPAFPWGTVTVNLSGCFLFGLVWIYFTEKVSLGGDLRTIVLVGFMGAFTTFSTFVFETGGMLQGGQWLAAAANLTLQNLLGLAALFLGSVLGRAL